MIKSYFTDKKLTIPYHLQYFANGDSGEKTEKATPKKREKAREEGQVAKSMEVTTALMLVVMFTAIKLFTPYMYERLHNLYRYMYQNFDIAVNEFSITFIGKILKHAIMSMFEILFPFFGIVVAIGLIGNFLQVGWKPSLKTMKPKFNKLNPIQGFKRLFSLKSVMELIKSLLKIIIIIAIVYMSVNGKEGFILYVYELSLLEAFKLMTDIALDIGIKVGAFFYNYCCNRLYLPEIFS